MYTPVQAASEIADLMADARQGLADTCLIDLLMQDALQFCKGSEA